MMTTSLFMTEKMYVFGVQASHTCINKHMYTHTHTHPRTQNAGSKLSKQYEIYVLPQWFLRVSRLPHIGVRPASVNSGAAEDVTQGRE